MFVVFSSRLIRKNIIFQIDQQKPTESANKTASFNIESRANYVIAVSNHHHS